MEIRKSMCLRTNVKSIVIFVEVTIKQRAYGTYNSADSLKGISYLEHFRCAQAGGQNV